MTKSLDDYRWGNKHHPKHLIAWERFGRLVAMGKHERREIWNKWEHKRFELVKCDCGRKKRVMKSELKRGGTVSCWCYNREIIKRAKTHWDSHTVFYQRRAKAKQRCECKTDKRYPLYGWRWIKFKRDSYQSFKDDMYDGFIKHSKIYWEHNTTLDRVNPDWDYCKENCRRVTISENCWQNKRQSREYRYNISAEKLSEITWYKKESLYTLLHKFWWDFNKMMEHITKNF